jgi:FKBP-type peptidyl-prolyl cis-trans isomerase
LTIRPYLGRGGADAPRGSCYRVSLAGCSGHHGSSAIPTSNLTATIVWPDRSRDVTNISTSAVAAIITATSGDPNTGDPVDFPPIIRAQNPDGSFAAHQDPTRWTSPTTLRLGATKIQIRFYPVLPSGSTGGVANSLIVASYGKLPSVGDALVPVTLAGTTTDIGSFAVQGNIAKVVVPPASVNFGNTASLSVVAYDASNNVLATLTPGSAFYAATTGSVPTVSAGGDITGNGLGGATVTATVNGAAIVNSNAAATAITSAPTQVSAIVGSNQTTALASGVLYRDTSAGSGAAAVAGQSVTITYTGYYSTVAGNVDSGSYSTFDTTYGATPRTVTLGSGALPAGLDQGVIGMLPGGTRILIVPAAQAGDTGLPAAAPTGSAAVYIVQRQ